MRIRVRVPVRPTEDEARVAGAVRALVPDATLRREGDELVGSGSDPEAFLKALRDQKIRDTARMVLARGADGSGATRFRLAKQAAAVGKVNFAVETPPLGAIEVTMEPDDLDAFLDSIAPAPPPPKRTAKRRGALHAEEKELEEHFEDFVEPPGEPEPESDATGAAADEEEHAAANKEGEPGPGREER